MANIIDGRLVSKKIKQEVADEVVALKEKGITPGLAVIIVGDDPASRVYVNHKKKDGKLDSLSAKIIVERFLSSKNI